MVKCSDALRTLAMKAIKRHVVLNYYIVQKTSLSRRVHFWGPGFWPSWLVLRERKCEMILSNNYVIRFHSMIMRERNHGIRLNQISITIDASNAIIGRDEKPPRQSDIRFHSSPTGGVCALQCSGYDPSFVLGSHRRCSHRSLVAILHFRYAFVFGSFFLLYFRNALNNNFCAVFGSFFQQKIWASAKIRSRPLFRSAEKKAREFA